ncbi:Stk1 family PASTA domain-containing Ser/Thr kinase [Streptomyces sudanensis]|uniref:Stk1 family PASTA domain-containing Ser/Thr kinase n=1 Tax=Streptomyces sudanensis TaxID=436397 RepID=UPI0020CFD068|nr:Stk1 family PASTA domain-containing Ser/Thr kinase [Streptomyces sudanensis]MCP9958235.1 Stk1 family PASTA domain-containing Ser/Thr kinase [Streptomyces sudanensis]MCP9987361.1 Stk1 family PASTA domain-containing Ser/Thr kinase [Streptomyces sudanensis]
MDEPRRLGGRYELGSVLGRGGMAEVYLAHDTRLGRTVAVKTLRADLARDPSFQARFRREAQSAASLNHPAIVAVYDTGEDYVDGVSIPYIVMEYVDGSTLRELLHSGRKLLPERTLEMTVGILQALEYSHRAGIVHRDIKPANVMLTRTGQVKVMDFGIARAMGDAGMTMTQTAAVIGTAQYLSPEQAKGETVDARSDLYSTGCLLYELLTVRPPFIGDSPVAVAYQHVREEPQPPSVFDPEITPEMDAIVLKALVKDPDYRYQSADEMRADIEACLDGQPVAATAAMGAAGGYGYPHPDQQTTAMHPADPGAQTSMLPPMNPDDGGYGYDDRGAGRRRQPQKKSNASTILLVLAGVLVLVGAILIGKSVFKEDVIRQVTVPSLVGKTYAEAEKTAGGSGVKVSNMGGERCEQPKGTICRQQPVANGTAQMQENGTIEVWVSEGAEKVKVPNVLEQSRDLATTNLENEDFKVKVVTEESEKTEGTVIRQDPEGGTEQEKGTEVTITIAVKGKVSVPRVVDSQFDNAKAQLETLKFQVVREDVDSDKPAGQVVDQNPKPDERVSEGSSITLRVSKGPKQQQVDVPQVTGLLLGQAKQVLAQRGLRLVVGEGPDNDMVFVVDQDPKPGKKVDAGTPVTVKTQGLDGNANGGNGGNGGGPGGGPGGGDGEGDDGPGWFGGVTGAALRSEP